MSIGPERPPQTSSAADGGQRERCWKGAARKAVQYANVPNSTSLNLRQWPPTASGYIHRFVNSIIGFDYFALESA